MVEVNVSHKYTRNFHVGGLKKKSGVVVAWPVDCDTYQLSSNCLELSFILSWIAEFSRLIIHYGQPLEGVINMFCDSKTDVESYLSSGTIDLHK